MNFNPGVESEDSLRDFFVPVGIVQTGGSDSWLEVREKQEGRVDCPDNRGFVDRLV